MAGYSVAKLPRGDFIHGDHMAASDNGVDHMEDEQSHILWSQMCKKILIINR